MPSRVDASQPDSQQVDDALELERRRALQGEDTRASQDLAARRVDEQKQLTGDDRSTQAVKQADTQQDRGAQWQSYADRANVTVPMSVEDIANESKKIEESSSANQAAKDDANRHMMQQDMQQRMTIAEIQAEAVKKSGMIRG